MMATITIDPSIIITAEQKATEALEQAWAALRAERDRRFEETRWLIERHAEELALDIATTLTPEQYTDLLTYRQALRDLPESTTDPTNPTWPEAPN